MIKSNTELFGQDVQLNGTGLELKNELLAIIKSFLHNEVLDKKEIIELVDKAECQLKNDGGFTNINMKDPDEVKEKTHKMIQELLDTIFDTNEKDEEE